MTMGWFQPWRLQFNDTITYRCAGVAPQNPTAAPQVEGDGPYRGKIVDFTDDGMVGVRDGESAMCRCRCRILRRPWWRSLRTGAQSTGRRSRAPHVAARCIGPPPGMSCVPYACRCPGSRSRAEIARLFPRRVQGHETAADAWSKRPQPDADLRKGRQGRSL